jgi:hypothetical protein
LYTGIITDQTGRLSSESNGRTTGGLSGILDGLRIENFENCSKTIVAKDFYFLFQMPLYKILNDGDQCPPCMCAQEQFNTFGQRQCLA